VIGLPEVIAGLVRDENGWRTTIPDGWLQGRTAYGGFSAALALHAAMAADEDLPPLRSAQVSFIGPLSGEIAVRAERLRRGRNAAFVQADVIGEAGLGLRATFVFMRDVESRVDHRAGRPPDFPRPAAHDRVFTGVRGVAFTQNFDFVDQRDAAALGPAEWLRWVRLRDRDGLHPAVELMAVADCLPPAAMRLLGGPAPVSSMTWLVNLLGAAPATTDGWWLLRSASGFAANGSSSQVMDVWNADGVPAAQQMQGVALFA